MSQYANGNGDAVDQILCDMRQHVSSLQDKLTVAATAVTKSQTVNEKIAIMSQYQDKVSTLNSCWRSKNRNNLVANLQHENRQMIALEEENRQLRFALKEMEDGLHLIMNDYRRVFSGFIRSDLLFDFAKIRNKVNVNGCIEFDKFTEIAKKAEQCVVAADQKIADQEEIISKLKYENDGLRELLHNNPAFNHKRESETLCFASQRKNSVIMVKEVSIPVALEDTVQSGRTTKDPLQPQPSSNQYKTVKNVNFNMIRGQSMPGCSSSNGDTTSSTVTGRWPMHNSRPKRAAILKKVVQQVEVCKKEYTIMDEIQNEYEKIRKDLSREPTSPANILETEFTKDTSEVEEEAPSPLEPETTNWRDSAVEEATKVEEQDFLNNLRDFVNSKVSKSTPKLQDEETTPPPPSETDLSNGVDSTTDEV